MCSAPWSVITSAPAECVGLLKLDTQPRSRQKRTGWRATPGHGGGWSVPPPPPNASSDVPEETCREPRGAPEQAGVAARAKAIWPVGGRSVSTAQEQSGEPSSERRSRSTRWWSAAALFFPALPIFFIFCVEFCIFLQIFDEILSGFCDKFQRRVTCVAFSIKFAKTN